MHLDIYNITDENLAFLTSVWQSVSDDSIQFITTHPAHDMVIFTQQARSYTPMNIFVVAEVYYSPEVVELCRMRVVRELPDINVIFKSILKYYKVPEIWTATNTQLNEQFVQIKPFDRAPVSRYPAAGVNQYVFKIAQRRDQKYYHKVKSITLPTEPPTPLNILASMDDGSCFFHCILYAITPNYHQLNHHDQHLSVRKFRHSLAENVTPELFAQLGNGETAKFWMSVYKAERPDPNMSEREIFEKVRVHYANTLRDTRKYAGEEYIDLLYRLFQVGILILTPDQHGEPTIYQVPMPDGYLTSCKKFVVLWYEQSHYNVVVSNNERAFDPDDKIVDWFIKDQQ